MACMEYWDERPKQRVLSGVAGVLFATGWWIFIDACNVVST